MNKNKIFLNIYWNVINGIITFNIRIKLINWQIL